MSSVLLRLFSPQDRGALGTGDHSSSSAESTGGHRGGGQGEQAARRSLCYCFAPAKSSRQGGIPRPTASMGPAAHPEPGARCSISQPQAECWGICSLCLYEHLNQPVLLCSPSRGGVWAPGKPHILAVTAACPYPTAAQYEAHPRGRALHFQLALFSCQTKDALSPSSCAAHLPTSLPRFTFPAVLPRLGVHPPSPYSPPLKSSPESICFTSAFSL